MKMNHVHVSEVSGSLTLHVTPLFIQGYLLLKKRVTLPTTIFFFFKHEEMYALDSDLK